MAGLSPVDPCEFRTLDNKKLIIPNGAIFGGTITKYTGYERRRVDVDVGAEYPADVDATRAALEKAASSIPGMLKEPSPQVFLKALGSPSVDWQVRVWCKTEDYWERQPRASPAPLELSERAPLSASAQRRGTW